MRSDPRGEPTGRMHIAIGVPDTVDTLKTFVEPEGNFSPGVGSYGIYFWLYNLSVPLTLVSLLLFVNGNTAIDPVLGLGSVLITVSAACFAWLLLTRLPSTK